MQRRINRAHMLAGVTMIDPDLVWIGPDVSLGRDVELLPMTFLFGATAVGDRARDRAQLATDRRDGRRGRRRRRVGRRRALSWDRAPRVGPVAYLRAGTVLEADSQGGCVRRDQEVDGGRGQQGPAPVLHRRRDDRQERQHRRWLDHLQLRRRQPSTRPSSATARSSALIPCSLRRSPSGRARSLRRAARSLATCPPARSPSSAPSRSTSRAGPSAVARRTTEG